MTAQLKNAMINPKRVDKLTALQLKQAGLTYKEVAKIIDTSPQAVHQAIKHLMPNGETESYKHHKADILSKLGLEIIKSIDSKRLKEASVNNLAYAFDKINYNERLERGESTANVDIRAITARAEELFKKLKDSG